MTTLREKRAAYAQRLVETKQLDKAVSLYNRMVADDPTDVDALRSLADLHLHLAEFGKALSAHERIAEHFYRHGQLSRAAAVYERIWIVIARHAPELRPRYSLITERLAEILLADADEDRALLTLERLLGAHHELTIARVAARRYLATGSRTGAAAALTHLRRCFKNDFVDSAAASLAVRAFDQLGHPQKGTLLLKESARIAWRIGDNAVYNALVDALTARSFDDTVIEFEARREMIRGEVTIVDHPEDSITNVDVPVFDDRSVSDENASFEHISYDGISEDDGATPIPLRRRISELPPLAWDDDNTPTNTGPPHDRS